MEEALPYMQRSRASTHALGSPPITASDQRFSSPRLHAQTGNGCPVSANVPEADAYELIKIFASAPLFASKAAFKKFRESLRDPFMGGRTNFANTRLTIAFGKRDWLLPQSARLRHEIPEDVIWQNRNGWGHVPMWDDPEGVTKFILEAIA